MSASAFDVVRSGIVFPADPGDNAGRDALSRPASTSDAPPAEMPAPRDCVRGVEGCGTHRLRDRSIWHCSFTCERLARGEIDRREAEAIRDAIDGIAPAAEPASVQVVPQRPGSDGDGRRPRRVVVGSRLPLAEVEWERRADARHDFEHGDCTTEDGEW